MATIPIRRVAHGPAIPVDLSRRRATRDAEPATLTAALPNMREVGRYPNVGAYALLLDTGTNQLVLYNFPVSAEPREAPDRPPPSGMYGNPTGGPTESMAPAMAAPRELQNGGAEWDRATGVTHDSQSRAFEARIHRLRTGIRMRSINDANRARHGQPPIDGGPGRAA